MNDKWIIVNTHYTMIVIKQCTRSRKPSVRVGPLNFSLAQKDNIWSMTWGSYLVLGGSQAKFRSRQCIKTLRLSVIMFELGKTLFGPRAAKEPTYLVKNNQIYKT